MAFTDAKWDGSASGYPDTPSYCRACLINLNPEGSKPENWTQDNCKLPVQTPDGDYNTHAMSSAAAVLNGGMGGLKGVSSADKAKAARKLKSLYAQAKMDVPPALKGMG